MSDAWRMPNVSQGDCVLFSTDVHNFSNPTLAWVLKEPKDSTITVLAFTNNGFIEKSSVHHKDDPSLHQEHGWQDLGAWDYTKQCKCLHDLMDTETPSKRSSNQRTKQE